jgi:hypothetical protein
MTRKTLWSIVAFTSFAFLAVVVFLWVREGSLGEAGSAMDRMLGNAGSDVVEGTGSVVDATRDAMGRATDGDDRT